MNTKLKINYYGLFLDKLYDDKEIYKSKALVSEKLYYIIMISMFGFIGTLLFFFYYIQYKEPHLTEVLEITAAKLYCIFIWWKSTNILDKLGKANRGLKIVKDLFWLQVQLVGILTILNIGIIYEVSVHHVSDMFISYMAMGNVFLFCVVFSSGMKIWLCILMEIWLINFTLHHLHDKTFGKVYLFSLHSYILLNIMFIWVQQIVLVSSWEEYSERVDVSFHTMHDLRNYLYSYIELNADPDVEEHQMKKIQVMPNNSKNIPPEYNNSNSTQGEKEENNCGNDNCNTTHQNEKTINEEPNEPKQNLTLSDDKKPEKIKYYGSVLMNAEPYHGTHRLTEEEREEKNQQQRFILFKVCFLYHLELMFDNSYNLKPRIVDVRELCQDSCETMKVLFQNKNNNISMEIKSMVQAINLDATIFEYLICDIAKFFHDAKYDDIKFIMFAVFKNFDLQFHIQVEVKDLDPTTIQQILGKHIIRKLIMTLNFNVSFKVSYDINRVKFLIIFPQPKEVIALMMRRNKRNRRGKSNMHLGAKSKLSNFSNGSRQSGVVKMSLMNNNFNSQSDQNKSVAGSELNESDTSFSVNYSNLSKMTMKKFVYNETIIIKRKLNEDVNIIGNMLKDDQPVNQSVKFEPVPENNRNDIVDIGINIETVQGEDGNENNEEGDYKYIPNSNTYELNDKKENSTEIIEETTTLTPLQKLLKDQREVTYEEKDGVIFINVDDENNILKMNKRMFTKEGHPLNGVTNIDDFLNLLRQIYINSTKNLTVPTLLCVMDHMLDREYGYEAVDMAIQQNKLLYLDMKFVLLSSTEDKETLSKYEKLGVNQAVTKPLNKSKLKPVLEKFFKDREEG